MNNIQVEALIYFKVIRIFSDTVDLNSEEFCQCTIPLYYKLYLLDTVEQYKQLFYCKPSLLLFSIKNIGINMSEQDYWHLIFTQLISCIKNVMLFITILLEHFPITKYKVVYCEHKIALRTRGLV